MVGRIVSGFVTMSQPDEASLATPSPINDLQVDILLALVNGEDPKAIADRLCLHAESVANGRLASIMLTGDDGHLHFFSAPSAPETLLSDLDDLVPGPHAGSCGNVVYNQQPTFVAHAREDERWSDLHEIAERWQIGSCWSYPIWRKNKLLGTFALTGGEERLPAEQEQQLLENLSSIAAAIIVYARNVETRSRERAQVRFLSKFIQRTRNGIVQFDRDDRVVWVNPAFETMSGYDFPDLQGRDLSVLYGERTSPTTLTIMRQAIENQESFSLDFQLYHRSGRPYWVRVDASPLFDEDNAFEGFFTIHTDITERRNEMVRLERAKSMYNMLAETNQQISEAGDEYGIYQAACQIAVQLGGMQLAWIGKPHTDGQFEFLATEAVDPAAITYLHGLRISVDPDIPEGCGISGRAYREGRMFFSQDFLADSRVMPWHEDARKFNLNASAALPILNRGKVIAVFCVYHHDHHIFDDELTGLLNELAQDITRGLDRLLLTQEAEEATEHLERQQALLQSLLAQIDTLITAENENTLLEVACRRLIESGLFLAAWVGRPDEQGRIDYLAAGGEGLDTLGKTPPLTTKSANHGVARALRDHTLTIDEQPDSPLITPWLEYALPGWQPAAVVLPLQRNDTLWAVMVAVAHNQSDIDRSMTEILARLSELLSQGLSQLDLRNRLAREQEQAAYLAHHDALTGLANRRALEQHMPRAMARTRRNGQLLAVALIDLDDFKPVNDQYGHAAGDTLLQELAQRFRQAVRETDLVARLGGDEFVLLLEQLADDNDLQQVLQRINKTVDDSFELNNGEQARIGLSIGITLYPGDESEPEQLIRHADAALYVCKSNKADRTENWCIWQDTTTAEALAQPAPLRVEESPYGQTAEAMLKKLQTHLERIADAFVERFYADIAKDPESMRILGYLSEREYAHLKHRQVEHFYWLLSPALAEKEHREKSYEVGEIHALLGIPTSSLVHSITIYFHQLGFILDHQPLSIRDQAAIERIVTGRLSNELGIELEAEQALNAQYQQTLFELDQYWHRTNQWTDFNKQLLDTLMRLPGIRGASISSPGEDGTFLISQSRGLDDYVDTMQALYGEVRLPRIDPKHPESDGPTARAYRFGQIQTLPSFATIDSGRPWREAAGKVGVRSAVSIPITDHRDQPIAVLSIYGNLPGMFESQPRQMFCDQLATLVAQAWRHMSTPHQIQVSTQELDLWRHAFYGGGLVMNYQPLIDTTTGMVSKFEALARLELENGTLVPPGKFLPWLSEHEIVRLFTAGLDQALEQLVFWERNGHHLHMAINLPPPVLANIDCSLWVSEALQRHKIPPQRLTLEILEDQEIEDRDLALNQLRALNALGVELAMDDLGSGYSSLLRLRTLPFHIVKIDQGLVRAAHRDPARVITFIGSLIQLAKSLRLEVTVEGLETPDLIEAAAILGADMSQGYAIARPMPAGQVNNWCKQCDFQVDTSRPQTALGALASHWRWTSGQVRHGDHDGSNSMHYYIEREGLIGSKLDRAVRQLRGVTEDRSYTEEGHRDLIDTVTELLAERVLHPPAAREASNQS